MQLGSIRAWGGLRARGRQIRPENLEVASRAVALSRGLGSSYGDASLPGVGERPVMATDRADRLLHFDPQSGRLRAEAGLSLAALNRVLLPRGWFAPVTPGTEQVTLGGMVAADVHGKDHHQQGSFGEHVVAVRLRTGDGRALWCGSNQNAELFRATLGGMGLTGHLLEVEFDLRRVPSQWISARTEPIGDIEQFADALHRRSAEWPYTVGWIDPTARGRHLGRGVLISGRWAVPGPARRPATRLRVGLPPRAPSRRVGQCIIRALSKLYMARCERGPRFHSMSPARFFYPLDRIRNWNRVYGPAGVAQYQFVVPQAAGWRAVAAMLERVASSRWASAGLIVIKSLGEAGSGVLSFPMRGITVAIDLPIGQGIEGVVADLNRELLRWGGRIYLAKDAYTSAADFAAMEGARLREFTRIRREWDPGGAIASALSARLMPEVAQCGL